MESKVCPPINKAVEEVSHALEWHRCACKASLKGRKWTKTTDLTTLWKKTKQNQTKLNTLPFSLRLYGQKLATTVTFRPETQKQSPPTVFLHILTPVCATLALIKSSRRHTGSSHKQPDRIKLANDDGHSVFQVAAAEWRQEVANVHSHCPTPPHPTTPYCQSLTAARNFPIWTRPLPLVPAFLPCRTLMDTPTTLHAPSPVRPPPHVSTLSSTFNPSPSARKKWSLGTNTLTNSCCSILYWNHLRKKKDN